MFKVGQYEQNELDRICSKFGLCWRKERNEDGTVNENGPLTFIQEAFKKFTEHRNLYGDNAEYIQKWYPGYPHKRKTKELPSVVEAGTAPPKFRNKTANAKTPKK